MQIVVVTPQSMNKFKEHDYFCKNTAGVQIETKEKYGTCKTSTDRQVDGQVGRREEEQKRRVRICGFIPEN